MVTDSVTTVSVALIRHVPKFSSARIGDASGRFARTPGGVYPPRQDQDHHNRHTNKKKCTGAIVCPCASSRPCYISRSIANTRITTHAILYRMVQLYFPRGAITVTFARSPSATCWNPRELYLMVLFPVLLSCPTFSRGISRINMVPFNVAFMSGLLVV